jgi:hypothetical protein
VHKRYPATSKETACFVQAESVVERRRFSSMEDVVPADVLVLRQTGRRCGALPRGRRDEAVPKTALS